jgi:hypothetical protein
VERDREYNPTYDSERSRRRGHMNDDPRRDPRERYGNEEDPYSREAARAYRDHDFTQRMHDDRPYNQPGYEPEMGRPGGRQNVERDRDRGRSVGGGQPESRFQGRYEDAWRRGSGGDPYGYDWEQPPGNRGQAGLYGQRPAPEPSGESWQADQGDPYGRGRRSGSGRQQAPRYRSGQPSGGYSSGSPYDQGDIGSWYGADTGMGEAGSSLDWQPDQRQSGSFQQRQASPFGQPRPQDRQSGQHEGPFSGRGPRGYQRSDERIREDVCELLTRHGQIDATSMEVAVQLGTVILRGMADSGRTRRLTEEIVEDVPGVRDVENQLRVNQRSGYSDTSEMDRGDPQVSGAPDQQHQQGHTQSIQTHSTPAYGTGVTETSGVSTRTGPGEPGISAGAGPSQHGNRWQIRETMDVVGSDGESIGTVKMVRGTDFQVDRPMSRDLYVPFSAVRTVDSERVLLSCRAAEVDQQNWPAASPV